MAKADEVAMLEKQCASLTQAKKADEKKYTFMILFNFSDFKFQQIFHFFCDAQHQSSSNLQVFKQLLHVAQHVRASSVTFSKF